MQHAWRQHHYSPKYLKQWPAQVFACYQSISVMTLLQLSPCLECKFLNLGIGHRQSHKFSFLSITCKLDPMFFHGNRDNTSQVCYIIAVFHSWVSFTIVNSAEVCEQRRCANHDSKARPLV